MSNHLLDAATLAQWLERRIPLTVLDCRARLGDPHAGVTLWREGHVPGSRHLDLDRDLAGPPGEGGRHPLPAQADFTASVQRLGIASDVPVVVYDDMGGQLAAARAWWMLARWARHPRVLVLDGGLATWQSLGGELQASDDAVPETSAWQPRFDFSELANSDEVAGTAALKLDARGPERFRGDREPIDPVAGHIPGAQCRPSTENLMPDGRFKPAGQLDAELPRTDETIAYCGSGVTACHTIFAHALAGRPLPKLYAGSWSHWIRDPARPVATGD